jgi:hypothetical protein
LGQYSVMHLVHRYPVAAILAAGLVAFPGSVQEAQANPCSLNQDGDGADTLTITEEQECDLTGYFEFYED